MRLSRQICAQHVSSAGYLPLFRAVGQMGADLAESMVGQGDERHLIALVRKKTFGSV